jgi:hypothetical protein
MEHRSSEKPKRVENRTRRRKKMGAARDHPTMAVVTRSFSRRLSPSGDRFSQLWSKCAQS